MLFFLKLLQFVSWALSAYIIVILAAAVITWVNPDPRNPIVQFLNRVTDPAFARVRRMMNTWYGGVDIAPVILIFMIAFVQQVVIASLGGILSGGPPVLVLVTLISFVSSILTTYMWLVIAAAVVSWINADFNNPIVRALFALTEPVLYRIRRMIPINLGGLDISPMILIAAILFVQRVLLSSLAGMLMGAPLPM